MRLIWSPLALDRALEAKAYIAADNPGAAEKWASGLVRVVAKLKRHPKLGRIVPEIGLQEYREVVYGNYLSGHLPSVRQNDINSYSASLQPTLGS